MRNVAADFEFGAEKAVCFREDELQIYVSDGTSSEVREGYHDRKFSVIDESRNITTTLHSYRPETGFYSPMHFHHFPHIRYVISGEMRVGKELLRQGDCVYHPEYIPYDIRESSGKLPHFLQIDYMGHSGFPMLIGTKRWGEAMQELARHGTIDGGIYRSGDGTKRNLEAAVAEHLTGKKFARKKPLMGAPLTIHTDELPWTSYAEGVSVKHIVYASSTGPNIKLVRLDEGAVLPAGVSACQQARYVIEGGILWGGEEYSSVSMMYYPPNANYPETVAKADSTTLFIAQWTNVGEESPPFAAL